MSPRGAGDRWLAGEQVEGVGLPLGATVTVVEGEHAGEHGVVRLLVSIEPEARYVVELASGVTARLRESILRAEPPAGEDLTPDGGR